MTKKEFEKLWLRLENCTAYDAVDIAIANCSDDWSFCSIVIHALWGGGSNIVAIQMDEEETRQVRNALTKTLRDMQKETL